MKKLILVSGAARSGKDSFVTELTKDLDSCQVLDITGGLKKVVAEMFGIDLRVLEHFKDMGFSTVYTSICENGTDYKKMEFTLRHFLQFIGNEIAPPLLGKYHWCMERQHEMFKQDREVNILCGVRQLKEVEYFAKMNPDKEVIVVKLIRTKGGEQYSPINEADKSHSTETEVNLITKSYCNEQGAKYYEFTCEGIEELNAAANTFKQIL